MALLKIYNGNNAYNAFICSAGLPAAVTDEEDIMIYSITQSSKISKYAIFVKTWTTTGDTYYLNSVGWGLANLKCAYYVFTINAYYFWSDTSISSVTNNFIKTDCNSQTSYSAPVIKYYSHNYLKSDGTDLKILLEVDITQLVSGSGLI